MPGRSRVHRSTPDPREDWAASLERELCDRGLDDAFARETAERLAPFADDLPDAQLDAALSGIVLAFGVHRRAVETFRKTTHDLEEVQQLLGAFGGELQKLDEALELLAAYAARLKLQTKPGGDPTLH